MLRSDTLGLTSIMRDLALAPNHYESILHFFHSSSWSLESISSKWFEVIKNFAPLYYEGNSVVLIGDGVKQAIEGYVMCSCIALGLLQILAMHFQKKQCQRPV